ncbi:hypothetical protein [Flavobacterium sp.]
MKKRSILGIIFIAASLFTGCKKETLHTEEIIRKHKLTEFAWDFHGTPFQKNASLYANRETDSCLLILKDKEGDTILSHLDKSIVSIANLQYEKLHGDWVIKKTDYGKTIFSLDSVGDWGGGISGSNDKNLRLDRFYTIDRKKKELKMIKPVAKKELLNKIASKFPHLKNCTIAALNPTNTYVFKDTLNDRQVLYQLETKYTPKYTKGKYTVQPEFGKAYSNGLYKNGVMIYESSDSWYFGEKVYYGKSPWQYDFRYRIVYRKFYRFKAHVKDYGNIPGNEIFKTEILVKDLKNKTTKTIKDFPKDSLFDNQNFVIQKYRNGKVELGVNGPDQTPEMYYELDTIHWKLTQLKKL